MGQAKQFMIFSSSFFAAMLLLLLLRRNSVAQTLKAANGIPLVGGIAMGIAFVLVVLVSLLFSGGLSLRAIGVLTASVAMLLFGIADDKWELSIASKFLVQFLAAALLIIFDIRTHIILIGDIPNIALTILWVVGITNAFNHFDIMDGVAGGVSLIVSFCFFAIAAINHNDAMMAISLALLGAIAGFLSFNLPPAKVYMGNAGSHFLGFLLAACALEARYAPLRSEIALFTPLMILGLPIFDTAFLICTRMRQKKSIFRKSDHHFVQYIVRRGYSRKAALAYMLFLALMYAVCGITLLFVSNHLGAVIVIAVAAGSFLLASHIRISESDGR
jgi:UDP-GlcNAc:undecaprenyl-phosphate/decaprenyl-phosphate GlcNAc-1-phosphate transferase